MRSRSAVILSVATIARRSLAMGQSAANRSYPAHSMSKRIWLMATSSAITERANSWSSCTSAVSACSTALCAARPSFCTASAINSNSCPKCPRNCLIVLSEPPDPAALATCVALKGVILRTGILQFSRCDVDHALADVGGAVGSALEVVACHQQEVRLAHPGGRLHDADHQLRVDLVIQRVDRVILRDDRPREGRVTLHVSLQ